MPDPPLRVSAISLRSLRTFKKHLPQALSRMPLSALQKGKGRLLPSSSLESAEISGSSSPLSVSSGSSSSSPSSESESDSDMDSLEDEGEGETSPPYLDSLLEKARASIAAKVVHHTSKHYGDASEDVIKLDDPESELKCVLVLSSLCTGLSSPSHSRHLPPLDPGVLPPSYITFGKALHDAPSAIRDLDAERAMESSSSLSVPAPPAPPPELTKSGKPLTAKDKKAV
jgi:hypothetical protein